ncbi:MAG: hypothetical protein GQ525_16845 [Draconibacterium sp.]|nr:hypothetical protein [Draconibacterium sp.]
MKLTQNILTKYFCIKDFDYVQSDGHSERSRTVGFNGTRIIFFLFLFSIVGAANAQQIKATAKLDSTNILLGDQIKLFLEIDHPKNIEIEFPQIPDSLNLGLIEVLGRSGIDTFELDNEELQKQIQSYTITCFDSGSYRITPKLVKININGKIDSVPTNGVTLNVFTMQVDTTKGPTDIKMPYDAPLSLKEVTPYILGVILIGAIIFLILYSIKRRKNNKPIFARPQKPKEAAHIVAIRELNRIKTEKIWQKGKAKQYHSEVSEALRVYVEDRFEIPAMEQTSDETIESFRVNKQLLSDKLFSKLSQILKLADLVKFAKYKPLPDDDSLSLSNAYTFVNETKKVEEKKKDEGGEKGVGREKEKEKEKKIEIGEKTNDAYKAVNKIDKDV